MKLTISVTQEHIDRGCSGDTGNCPIALALIETVSPYFNEPVYVSVAGNMVVIAQHTKMQARTPSRGQQFIGDFDGGRTVHPMTFEADFTARPR